MISVYLGNNLHYVTVKACGLWANRAQYFAVTTVVLPVKRLRFHVFIFRYVATHSGDFNLRKHSDYSQPLAVYHGYSRWFFSQPLALYHGYSRWLSSQPLALYHGYSGWFSSQPLASYHGYSRWFSSQPLAVQANHLGRTN